MEEWRNAGSLVAILHAPTNLKPFTTLHAKGNFSAKRTYAKFCLIKPEPHNTLPVMTALMYWHYHKLSGICGLRGVNIDPSWSLKCAVSWRHTTNTQHEFKMKLDLHSTCSRRFTFEKDLSSMDCKKREIHYSKLSAVCFDLNTSIGSCQHQLWLISSLCSCLLALTLQAEVLSLPCPVTVWVLGLFLIWVNAYLERKNWVIT
jgi:hypothetical protein